MTNTLWDAELYRMWAHRVDGFTIAVMAFNGQDEHGYHAYANIRLNKDNLKALKHAIDNFEPPLCPCCGQSQG